MKKTRNYFIYCNSNFFIPKWVAWNISLFITSSSCCSIEYIFFKRLFIYIHVLVCTNPRKWCSSTFLIVLMQVYNNSKQHPSFKKKKQHRLRFLAYFIFFFRFLYSKFKTKLHFMVHWISSLFNKPETKKRDCISLNLFNL